MKGGYHDTIKRYRIESATGDSHDKGVPGDFCDGLGCYRHYWGIRILPHVDLHPRHGLEVPEAFPKNRFEKQENIL